MSMQTCFPVVSDCKSLSRRKWRSYQAPVYLGSLVTTKATWLQQGHQGYCCRLITSFVCPLLYSFMRKLFLSVARSRGRRLRIVWMSRSTEKKNGERMANYIFVRAHDSEVQTVIADIIQGKISIKYWWFDLYAWMSSRSEAFKDLQRKICARRTKKYTQFNIPTAHALMLSNKELHHSGLLWGSLYWWRSIHGEKNLPYHDAIDALLRARIKYVAGGRDMKVTYMGVPREADKWSYNGIFDFCSLWYWIANEAA